MSRKIIIFCITIFLLLTCCHTAFATGVDISKTGSVSVTLVEKEQDQAVVGAELSVYHVATVTTDAQGNPLYDYTEAFKQLDVAISDLTLASKLDGFVSQHSVPSVKMVTDANGRAFCDGLTLGLYFVKQTGAVDGFSPCIPFLVTLPAKKDGGYVYEVNASPKTEVTKLVPITVKKVWNTDKSAEATESVTVSLLKDGNVVKTAVLSKENDWQITYNDMPKSDTYSIKEVDVPKGFTATYTQSGYTYTVTNTSTLIQTGQLVWPIPVLSACGMLLIAAGIALLRKKRKTNA